ncbi:MAG: four helix bundle protein [Anaerolineales bacterium]
MAYETLEIWQLAMKLVEITHSLRKQFPREERYGLWSQLVNAVESTPLLIAEGYGRKTPRDRAHFMDQAIASNLEAKTAYQISVKKGYVTIVQFEKLISPLIEKIHFKTIGFKKYLLKKKAPKRSDQPAPPRHQSVPINRFHQAKRSRGFTLIEIMVVVGILGIIAVVGSGAFFSILRGSTKTKTLQMVKQNGDYAISVMERMIRNARSVSGGGNSITITNPDGMNTTFSCSGNMIASNSASLVSSEVKVDDCSNVFTVTPGEVGIRPAVVKINFNLSQAGTPTRPEEQASINFQTTVSLRNY